MYPLVEIKFKIKDGERDSEVPEIRKKMTENKIVIYSKTVSFKEIMDHIIFDIKKVRRKIMEHQISWMAVSAHL